MLKKLLYIIATFVFQVCMAQSALGNEKFIFNEEHSTITGSISCSVVGKYKVTFNKFNGHVLYDPKTKMITSVNLTIVADSLNSKFEYLDKIVRSSRFLNTKQYPNLVFKGESIRRDGKKFKVDGLFEARGIVKKMTFGFEAGQPLKAKDGRNVISAKGSWSIPRKAFDIIWNKYLDKGGIVVGDYINVDWEITAFED